MARAVLEDSGSSIDADSHPENLTSGQVVIIHDASVMEEDASDSDFECCSVCEGIVCPIVGHCVAKRGVPAG